MANGNALEQHVETRVVDALRANYDVIKSVAPQMMDAKRMAKLIVGAIRLNPKLAGCTPASALNAVITAASYGLEIRPGSAYLVPFGKECTLLVDYRGKIDLALRSGIVTGISAEVVCANDEFDCSLGAEPKLIHRPLYYRKNGDGSIEPVDEAERGPMVLAYAAARMKNGQAEFVLLSRSQIIKIKDAQLERLKSQGRNVSASPWTAWEAEMRKKTAVHRLCKRLPQSPEQQALEPLEESLDKGDALPWLGIKDDGKPLLEASSEAAQEVAEDKIEKLRAEEARLLAERKAKAASSPPAQVDATSERVDDEPELTQDDRDAAELRARIAQEEKAEGKPVRSTARRGFGQ